MADPSTSEDSRGTGKALKRTNFRELITIMVLGALIGMVFTIFVGTVLWSLGYLTLGQAGCPDPDSICPPAVGTPPVCPTCGVLVVTVTPTPTATSTPSATPDIQATGTAACQAFAEEFPGTPCPPLEATATP